MDAGLFVAEDEVVEEFRGVGVFLVGGGFGGGLSRFGVRLGSALVVVLVVVVVCVFLTAESSLVVCDALVDGCADVDLVVIVLACCLMVVIVEGG